MFIFTQIKAVLLGMAMIIFMLFPVSIIVCPFHLGKRLQIIGPLWSFFGKVLLKHACGAQVVVCEDHRSPSFQKTPPYGLYVANHQSYIDIPLMLTMYQAPPIMKKEVLYIPIFGLLAWASGALPVSRANPNSRKKVFIQAKKRMSKDKIGLQVYPEGTRSKDSLPKPFSEIKKTLLVFAFHEKIPVIPTSIYGTRGVLNHLGIIRQGQHLGIIVHKEIHPESFTCAEDFAKAAWDQVIKGHDELKDRLNRKV
jgi:1-acyl-sn-glycerol-3-phosphate acyltransferase